jgi:hypothetical protein
MKKIDKANNWELVQEESSSYAIKHFVRLSQNLQDGYSEVLVAKIEKENIVLTRLRSSVYSDDENNNTPSTFTLSKDEMTNISQAWDGYRVTILEKAEALERSIQELIKFVRNVLNVHSDPFRRNAEEYHGNPKIPWSIERSKTYGNEVLGVETNIRFQYDGQSILNGSYTNLATSVTRVLKNYRFIDEGQANAINEEAAVIMSKSYVTENLPVQQESSDGRDPFLDYAGDNS